MAGLSLGGAVTLTLLRRHPEVVETALVSGTAAKIGKFLGWVSLSSLGMIRNTPLQSLGEPGDIAAAALYLASPASRWVTGKTIEVDGGAESTVWPG